MKFIKSSKMQEICDDITIGLTLGEANELIETLQDIIDNPGTHHHISSNDYKSELTVFYMIKNRLII